MKKEEVIALLKANRNERGIEHWKQLGPKTRKLESFGIGLTQLRKLAKKIGRDHRLAQQLWGSNIYDAKVIGLLIDEPKKLTREQADKQVEELNAGMLAHVFASCDATLAKSPFAFDLALEWMESQDNMRRRCGYLLLYELSKNKSNKALDDPFFIRCIDRIQDAIHQEENWVRDAMNTSLLGMGKRNRTLNKAAIRAARAIGPVQVDYGDNSCEALDVLKHLTSDYLKKKWDPKGALTKKGKARSSGKEPLTD
jgi:3-methyladenine DNA glycosylase AlkD